MGRRQSAGGAGAEAKAQQRAPPTVERRDIIRNRRDETVAATPECAGGAL